MDVLTQILLLETAYRGFTGLAPTTVSKKVGQGGAFFDRLRSGRHTCNIRTAVKVQQWFSDHWPEDIAWPVDIPRPEPTKNKGVA